MRTIPGTVPRETLARIERALPAIQKNFGTPCFVYDEQGIIDRVSGLRYAMRDVYGYEQFYAVKAWPNPANLRLQHRTGSGFDCSSPYELHLMEMIGAFGSKIILTSNNSRQEWFDWTNRLGGIINLDDIRLIEKVRDFPGTISFRLNPGKRQSASGLKTFSEPVKAKYGITWRQMIPAYRRALERGAKIFGLHTMVASNCRDEDYLVDNFVMGLEAAAEIEKALGIQLSFFNGGGGFGITYKPTDKTLNIRRIGERMAELQDKFRKEHGYVPRFFTEMGRWVTGPFGVLLVSAINRKDTYQIYIGVDAGMEALARPAFYDAYHHIWVFGADRTRGMQRVNITGSICENWDRLTAGTKDGRRLLPIIKMGEVLGVANCGAHARAMGFNYNGVTRPQEVMIRANGTAELIRRAETFADLDATLQFEKKIVQI